MNNPEILEYQQALEALHGRMTLLVRSRLSCGLAQHERYGVIGKIAEAIAAVTEAAQIDRIRLGDLAPGRPDSRP